VRFSTGILRRRFQKTQAECLDGREKKVTELLPTRYAGIPFLEFDWFAPGLRVASRYATAVLRLIIAISAIPRNRVTG